MSPSKQKTEERNATAENAERLVEQVRQRYGRIAQGAESGCCASADREQFAEAEAATAQRLGYETGELTEVPEELTTAVSAVPKRVTTPSGANIESVDEIIMDLEGADRSGDIEIVSGIYALDELSDADLDPPQPPPEEVEDDGECE